MGIFNTYRTESADDWIDEWSADVDRQVSQATDLVAQISALSVDAYTADGAVEVTLDSRGAVSGLRLDERVLRWTPDEIADEFMRAIQRANELMVGRVADVVSRLVGLESDSGRAVARAFKDRVQTDTSRQNLDEAFGYDVRI